MRPTCLSWSIWGGGDFRNDLLWHVCFKERKLRPRKARTLWCGPLGPGHFSPCACPARPHEWLWETSNCIPRYPGYQASAPSNCSPTRRESHWINAPRAPEISSNGAGSPCSLTAFCETDCATLLFYIRGTDLPHSNIFFKTPLHITSSRKAPPWYSRFS